MRATLLSVGAFLFLAYPMVLLCAVATKIDQPREKPVSAAITLTPGSANDMLNNTGERPGRRGLRNTTLRGVDR